LEEKHHSLISSGILQLLDEFLGSFMMDTLTAAVVPLNWQVETLPNDPDPSSFRGTMEGSGLLKEW
jgi:hypothetical protein